MATSSPHLLVALTPHGYGHGAMTAPIINRLRARCPGLRLTLQTAIAREWLESRYDGPFDLVAEDADFGMVMKTTLVVDAAASHARYVALHERLDELVARDAERMRVLGADLLLSNISYIALLAAQRAGVPSLAMSCLNWLEIYGYYCREMTGAGPILEQMRQGYQAAQEFLCPAPSMPMTQLSNIRPIGPLARRGVQRRADLNRLLGAAADDKIGLIAFGGMDLPLDYKAFPRLPGVRWVVAADPCGHPDMTALDQLPLTFTDLLTSCDLILGKPGYGTFAEAAVNGTAMLTLPRPDWPESPGMVHWLEQQGRCLTIGLEDLFKGDVLAIQLQTLFSLPQKPLPDPSGAEEGVVAILAALARAGHPQE